MAVLHGIDNLEENVSNNSVVASESLLLCNCSKKITTRRIFQYQVDASIFSNNFLERQDTSVARYFGVECHLVLCCFLLCDQLDGVASAGWNMYAEVDNAVCADTKDRNELDRTIINKCIQKRVRIELHYVSWCVCV